MTLSLTRFPSSPSRRAVLAGVAAIAVTAALNLPAEAAPRRSAAGPIVVDTGPLAARGLGGYAERVRRDMLIALQQAYGGRLQSGSRLIVRIDQVQLASYVGDDEFPLRSSPRDYMQGEGTLLDARGAVIGAYPILAAIDASSGGAWYLPSNEGRRLAALSQHFASWLRRYTGA